MSPRSTPMALRLARRVSLAFAIALAAAVGGCTTPVAGPGDAAAPARLLAADTPGQTNRGNSFVAPAGWTLGRIGELTRLEAPEKGSRIGLIDIDAPDAPAAVAAAWKAFDPAMARERKVTTPAGPRDGWSNRSTVEYITSPNEHRSVEAYVRRANGVWTVVLLDMGNDVYEKRSTQVGVLFSRLLPKGYVRESFAGQRARTLDALRLEALRRFVREAMQGHAGARRGPGHRAGRPGRAGRRLRRAGAGPAREGGRADALPGRVEHEGARDADAGPAGGRRPHRLGDAGRGRDARVPAGRRRHHRAGEGQAPDLRLHRAAAPGPRVALRVPRRDGRDRLADPVHDAADE